MPKQPGQLDQTEIGAMWKKSSATQKFLSGTLDFGKEMTDEQWDELVRTRKCSFVSFSNKFKQNDQHPDLRIYLSRPKPSAPAPRAAAPPARPAARTQAAPAPAPEPEGEPSGDEII